MIDWIFTGKYSFLDNFYDHTIEIDGKTYPTTEHYFQACKAKTEKGHELIRNFKCPSEAKMTGNMIPLREDWENKKIGVMKKALVEKFKDPELRAGLLATGDEVIIEGNTWGDRYWGKVDGVGRNKLGKMLMALRKVIRENEKE